MDLGSSGRVRSNSAQDTQLGDCPSNKEDQQDGEHRYPEPSECTEDALSGRSATSGPVGGGGVYLAPSNGSGDVRPRVVSTMKNASTKWVTGPAKATAAWVYHGRAA